MRAVITGMGVISPLGRGYGAFAEAVLADRCAVAPITVFPAATFANPVAAEAGLDAAEVRDIAAAAGVDEMAVRIDRKLALGGIAAAEALGCAFGDDVPADVGLSLGLGLEVLLLPDVAALYDRERRDLWDPLESTCRHASLSIL